MTAPSRSVLLVKSDDGSVDLLPTLRPRVSKDAVEAAVGRFEKVCLDPDETQRDEFGDALKEVEAYEFYMDEAQCERINTAYKVEMDRRLENGYIAIEPTPLKPHPEMNDTYWL